MNESREVESSSLFTCELQHVTYNKHSEGTKNTMTLSVTCSDPSYVSIHHSLLVVNLESGIIWDPAVLLCYSRTDPAVLLWYSRTSDPSVLMCYSRTSDPAVLLWYSRTSDPAVLLWYRRKSGERRHWDFGNQTQKVALFPVTEIQHNRAGVDQAFRRGFLQWPDCSVDLKPLDTSS